MNYDYKKLDADLNEILLAMKSFSYSDIIEVEQFISSGEYGLAFETFCGIAIEGKKNAPACLRDKVRKLAERMGIDPIWWEMIEYE